MKRPRLSRSAAMLTMAAALAVMCASDAPAADKPTIQVSTTAELYAAVQPANAGAMVLLASGTYTLDTSRPDSGRLVLPPGMELVGVKRQDGQESTIVVPALTGGQGAIRLGADNAVRWITVDAVVTVGACIDINVLPATGGMSAVVSDCRVLGGSRGIRCQHLGAGAAERHSTVLLERNEVRDQGGNFGFACQVQNGTGADGARFDVTLRDNLCSGARFGLFVVNVGCVEARNRMRSEGNTYSDNACGVVLHAGRDAAGAGSFVGATDSGLEFVSEDDTILDNVGDQLFESGGSGGVTAIAGFHTSDLASTSSGNQLEMKLERTRFAGNMSDGVERDVMVFGMLDLGTLPGSGNVAEAILKDVTAEEDTFLFLCSYPAQPTDGMPNIVEAKIDGQAVELDCD